MNCSRRFYGLLPVFLCFLTTLVAVDSQTLIPTGSQQLFELFNAVSLHDLKHSGTEDASYIFRTQLKINSVWNSRKEQLLQLHFSDSTVSAPTKTQKRQVTQEILKIPDRPFYISLVAGKPQKVIAHTSRDQSLLNLERGIASLLQLQYQAGGVSEVDVSGHCMAFYNVKSSTHISKVKTDCSHWDLRVNYRAEKPLGVAKQSHESIEFTLSADGALLKAISTEKHRISLEAKPDVGSEVVSEFVLSHLAVGDADVVEQLQYATLDEAIKSLLEWYRVFDIEADVDGSLSELKDSTLKQQVSANAAKLADDNIGKETLASTMAELLPLARITKQREFVEILQAHKDLHAQLVDLFAAVQTLDAHNAIHEVFKYNSKSDELLEKYLQSLAVSTHPDRAIIEDLFERLQAKDAEVIKDEKLRDTVLQTVASLTKLSGFDPNDPLLKQVRSYILKNLNKKCKEAPCKLVYIRALHNLQDPSTIPTLINNVVEGNAEVAVAAMHALKSFSVVNFNEQHRKSFAEIFYQNKRKHDTSVRTMALDILLALKPTKPQLQDLLTYLNSSDHHFEIKTYVIQKLRMLAEKCSRFSALLNSCLAELPEVNNYHVIGQKGMTTVLSRQLSITPAFNETLLSVQEIYQGVLKRGSVELLLAAGRDEITTFKIGMYTSGLSSFVGDSDDVDEDENDDNPATAGMEISVQGVLLRPLVFFTGQSELMGHVWSGTASDPTPAFQATTLAEDHEHYVLLASGATLYLRVLGMRTVDLNGKVEFSIWNRNANTEITQNSGAAVVGFLVVGFTYAKLENKFMLTNEPQISLQADIDFYSGIKLCMRLQRPEMILKHSNTRSVYLNASRPYVKHIHAKSAHKSTGRTLALNQKNNEMCNMIIEQSE